MTASTRTVEINADVFEVARRTASLDNVDVATLIESLVRRHAEYIDSLEELSAGMPKFSLDLYTPQRDPGESDEDFNTRKNLFR